MKSKQQRQRIEERRIRRERGECLDCGSPELANNKDGSRSKYCVPHLAVHSTAHRNKRRDSRPAIVRPAHIEIDEDGNPLPFSETKKGKAYEIALRNAIKRLGRTRREGKVFYTRVKLSQIKEYLGENYNDRHTLVCLESLEGSHRVRYEQCGMFRSWVYCEPPVEKPKQYNNSAAMHRKPKYHFEPVDRTRPAVESFPGGAA